MDPAICSKIVMNLKQQYSHHSLESSHRFVESTLSILKKRGVRAGASLELLDDFTQTICRNYRIREATTGFASQKDGLFRYVTFCGFRPEAEAALKELAYKKDDFLSTGKRISDLTWIYFSEDKAFIEGEESTFNRPILLTKTDRNTMDKCLEGDYFDTIIKDREGDLIGWIEYSGTQDYKFPEMHAIKEIELMSLIISALLDRSGHADAGQ
jgi:hypothetical protein